MPLPLSVTERVLKASNDLAAQLSIADIVKLGSHYHYIAILSKENLLPSCQCKQVKPAPGVMTTSSLNRLSTITVENQEGKPHQGTSLCSVAG
jgi:hypothetical protein